MSEKQQGQEDMYARLRTRSLWKPEDARRVLSEWRASGEKITAFARRNRLSLDRVRWWRDRLQAEGGGSAVRFVPAVVRAPANLTSAVQLSAVQIVVDHVRIEVSEPSKTDPSWLAAVVSGLRRSTL